MKFSRAAGALSASTFVLALALTGCSGASGSDTAASATPTTSTTATATSAEVSTADIGVTVKGDYGTKPTLTIPDTDAPSDLRLNVISEGEGDGAADGDVLVVNYLGSTWGSSSAEASVFDNSFDRSETFGLVLGAGSVITGWDDGLVGQKKGSRVLLSIPPDLAYGTTESSTNTLAGETLLFVVDVVDVVEVPDSATGTEVTPDVDGLPTVESASGEEPSVTSVEGVAVPDDYLSALLVKGTGETIDADKTLVLQIVQTDTATGESTTKTWGTSAQTVTAEQVLAAAPALKDQPVGSRVVTVTPTTSSSESQVLVIDVLAQY